MHTISFEASDPIVQLKKLTPDCGKPVLDIGDAGGGHMTMIDSNNMWAKIRQPFPAFIENKVGKDRKNNVHVEKEAERLYRQLVRKKQQ